MAAKQQREAALYLIAGDDDYLIDREARSLVDRLCPPAEQVWGLEIVEARTEQAGEAALALGRALEGVQTVGFLGGRKVVWLRDAICFGDNKVSKSVEVKAKVEALTRLIKAGLPPGQVLVVSAVKVDGRTGFYKACKAGGALTEFKSPARAAEAMQSSSAQASAVWAELGLIPARRSVLQAFVERVGHETRRLVRESEKLSSYLGAERRSVTEEDIAAVVSAAGESVSWDLADRAGERDLAGALRVLRQLLFQRESEIGLLTGLAYRFRELGLLKECMRRRWVRLEGSDRYQKPVWQVDAEGEQRLSECGRDPRSLHPFRAVKLLEQAGRYTLRELMEASASIAQAQEQMVSSTVPAALVFEVLLVRVLGRPDAAAGR